MMGKESKSLLMQHVTYVMYVTFISKINSWAKNGHRREQGCHSMMIKANFLPGETVPGIHGIGG
jgi:hypothetical protein